MRRAAHARNLAVTLAVICGIILASGWQPFASGGNNALAAPLQQGVDFTWNPTSGTISVQPGQQNVSFRSTLTNRGTSTDTLFNINTNISSFPGWSVLIAPASSVSIAANGSQEFTFFFSAPANAPAGTSLTVQITASRSLAPSVTSLMVLTINIVAPTATPTQSPTPTTTVGPTATAGPTCSNGRDVFDPIDDTFEGATLIVVDVSQLRGICSRGDHDWFKFGAIGGKVYTIDVTQMDDGLDLSIDLYDSQGNRLTSNDDFFNRNPSTPDPKDIKPRIQSWRAPRDGVYFFRIRDTIDVGGGNRTYTVIINSESYGPTPVTVSEVCRDLFEEDGLPEQARLITSNEVQPSRLLCPTGDADWVRFFGLGGKTYYLYTDTRPYRNSPDINNQTEAGADTVLYLADRDGISIIDFNDDIAGSLDSELRFTPVVDGFYYAQIKNVGDIGNQFIRYDLVLKLCVPGEECGRSPVTQVTPTKSPLTPTGTRTPTPTEADFLDETATPTRTPTATPTEEPAAAFSQNARKPGPLVNGPLRGFADSSFQRVWERNDKPVAVQRAARSWMWGPGGLMARTEGYLQSASGLRQVQYFDKGRMEVNNPQGDRSSKWFVTTGLLVIELITGRTQIGDQEFVQRAPADIPIAGDPGDPNAPTYASFGGVTGLQPGDRTGQPAHETIDRSGQVGAYGGPQRPETQLARFIPESGHNIPRIFWDYLNASGTVYEGGRYRQNTLTDWVFTLGYPISDPYWTRVRVGGVERDVLVQIFQRRVLTYSPDNPRGWQVEMGNVGRHYYFWRYGEELPS